MRRTLLTIALVACGGGDAKPQTQAAATAAQPPPPPPLEVTASAAATAAPSETPSATPAETIAALDAGVGLAALTRTEPDDEPLGAGGESGGHGSLGGHAPHVSIRQGTTMINGRLPPEVIQRIVRQHYGRFRACYEQGLRQDPSLAGRVAIKFVIGSKGDVTLAADGGSEMTNIDVVTCVMVGFKSLIFPKPERGIVTVVYPLIFSSSH